MTMVSNEGTLTGQKYQDILDISPVLRHPKNIAERILVDAIYPNNLLSGFCAFGNDNPKASFAHDGDRIVIRRNFV